MNEHQINQPAEEQCTEAYRRVLLNDSTVHQLVRRGVPPEGVIVALCEQKERMMKRIVELESIAPRKIKRDGKTYVWHCPNELIPE